MQEEEWPPKGATIIEKETQEEEWPPKGATIIEEETQEEEWPPKGAQVIEPTTDEELETSRTTLFADEAVSKANADAEKLKLLKEEQESYTSGARKKRTDKEKLQTDAAYQKSLKDAGVISKEFDYKQIEITQPDGTVKSYPYSEVHKNYGDVDEYVKRWKGKAKIVDTTPKEQQTAEGFVDGQDIVSPEAQAKIEEDAKRREKHILKLEEAEKYRTNEIKSLEAKEQYKEQYVDAKNLKKEIGRIDENSDETKLVLGRQVYESISEAIDGESMWGFDTDDVIESVEAGDDEAAGYMEKYFKNDKEFYTKWKEFDDNSNDDTDGNDYDYEYLKKKVGANIVRDGVRQAKEGFVENYYTTKEYDGQTRRRVGEFIMEDIVGTQDLYNAKADHDAEVQRRAEVNTKFNEKGERIVNKVVDPSTGLLIREDLLLLHDKYDTSWINNEGRAGKENLWFFGGEGGTYGEGSSLTAEEQEALMTKQYEKINLNNILLNEDMNTYNTSKSSLDKEMLPYTEKMNAANDRIIELEKNGISADSSPALIKEYNEQLAILKSTNAEMDQAGLLTKEQGLLENFKDIQSRNDILMNQAAKVDDLSLSVNAGLKNYSNLAKMNIVLEQSLLGSASMLAGKIGQGAQSANAWFNDKFTDASDEEIETMYAQAEDIKGASLDYNLILRNNLSENYRKDIHVDDVSWTNLDSYMGQVFANNSPSILTTVLTLPMGGLGGMASGMARGTVAYRVAAARAQLQAGKMTSGVFFTMGAGQKYVDLEVGSLDKEGRINALEESKKSALSDYEKDRIQSEINEVNRQCGISELQRFTSASIAGLSDMYMERLGSLSYVNKFTSIVPVVNASTFKKMMYHGLNTGLNLTKEIGEEIGVEMINNASDMILLGDPNKSLIDGINKDFLANVAFTSLAIQGPGMGSNAYNIIADEVKTRVDKQSTIKRRNEIFDIEKQLSNPVNLSKKDRKALVARKREIIKEEAMNDVMTTQRLARMSTDEKTALFDINAKRRKALANIKANAARGNSKTVQSEKARLTAEFQKLDTQRNELLGREGRKRAEKAKDNVDPAQYVHNMGLNDFYTDLVEMNQAKNKGGFTKYEGDNKPNLEQLTKKYGETKAAAIVKSFESGSNAANIDNDIFIFQDNIKQGMATTELSVESQIAAVAPMHELLHMQNRKAGIVKDGVVVEQATEAINQLNGVMKEKLDLGKITQEQYDNFEARKDLYTDQSMQKKGVDVEELLNLYGDFVSIGVLTPSSLNGMYGIKNTLSSLVNKFNPTNQQWLMPMETGNDVFGYLTNFKKSAQKMNVIIEEDEIDGDDADAGVLESKVIPDTTKTYMELDNSILQQALISEIENNGENQFTLAQAIVEKNWPLISKSLNINSQVEMDDAKEVVIDQLLGQFEGSGQGKYSARNTSLLAGFSLDPATGVPAAQVSTYLTETVRTRKPEIDAAIQDRVGKQGADLKEAITTTAEKATEIDDNKKRSIKLKERLTGDLKDVINKIQSKVNSLPIAKLDFKSLKNLALKEVQQLFGIKPKSGNLTKQDVANAQQYISKNIGSLISMLPKGATPSGTSTGVQKVLLDNFYTKTKRVSMAKTGSKAGLAVYEKNKNISETKFKEVFGITPVGTPNKSDRNTSSRIKALVSQTERMLANQEVREVMDKEGRPIPQALTQGKSEVMFSKSLINNKFTSEQQALIKKISEARNINQVSELLGLSSMTVNDKNRAEKQVELLKAIKQHELSSNVFEAAMPASSGALRFRAGKVPTLDMWLAENNVKDVEAGDVYYKLTDGNYALGVFKNTNKDGVKQFSPPVNDKGEPLTNLVPARGRLYYGKSDPNYKTALDATIKDAKKFKRIPIKKGTKIDKAFYNKNKEQSDINMDILEDVTIQLSNAVQLGMDPALAGLIIAQGYQATTGLIKVAAPFDSVSETFQYSKTGKQSDTKKESYIEEHNPPASVVGSSIIFAIAQNKVKELLPYIRKNYSQTQLSKDSDFLLDQSKLDAVLPKGATILDNSVIRYAQAGINLNRLINLETGKTFAEEQGLGVSEELKNDPNVIAMQNQLVEEQVFNGATNKETAADLKEYLKLVPDMAEAKQATEFILNESKVLNITPNLTTQEVIDKAKAIDKALSNARNNKKTPKKIRVFDFDDTIATTKSNVLYTLDGKDGVLTAEEFAKRGAQLEQDGAKFDFSEFNEVTQGKKGPLWNVAKAIKDARGNKDLFILTARSMQAQDAIYDFLKAQGLEFRKENIIGLGNSAGAAKANWIVDKAAEGYNDFYFADDAYQNVKAVQDVLDVVDVKSKVQQAIIKESKSLNKDFNNLLEESTGTLAYKKYSEAKGQVRGATKGRFKFWIPPSAEDFVGLIYPTLAKGEVGERQMAWYKEKLLDPYAKAMENLSTARLNLMQDFKALKKNLKVPKALNKEAIDGFTNEQAIRVYLWNKNGIEIPGLSKADVKELSDYIENSPLFKTFATQLETINKEQYPSPDQNWLVGTITTDLIDGLNTVKRKKYLEQWQQNADEIYSKENLSKLESIYGPKYVEALKNMLGRMKSGKNRTATGSRLTNKILDYINSSNAAIMFFNMRSAALQTISAVNFLNWGNNNPYKAGKAFANQPQYWADFTKLMNSDFLKDRRNGLRLNIHESEVAEAAKTAKNKAKGVLQYILTKGYLPTQYADSFAIASGGATFYRNRINELVKQGVDLKTAEETAMRDFREIAEESQQSSRPDKISQQQASPLGRLILMFANTPMQYARIQKRAFQDLIAGRGDKKAHVSKIVYYGVIQNLMFNALQQGLFALGFGDDELDEDDEKKISNAVNGMLDSTLRGLGVGGAAVSVVKNFLLDIYERSGRSRPEYTDAAWKLLQFSPPISSKISKIKQALWAFNSKKRRKQIFEGGFGLDNPAYESAAKVISATTNIPLDRVLNKWDNISSAMEEETDWWQSVAMLAGWPAWSFDKNEKEKKKSNKKGSSSSKKKGEGKGKSSKGRTRKK